MYSPKYSGHLNQYICEAQNGHLFSQESTVTHILTRRIYLHMPVSWTCLLNVIKQTYKILDKMIKTQWGGVLINYFPGDEVCGLYERGGVFVCVYVCVAIFGIPH